MKVTSVEPQKKNIRRFNIFLDGEFGFGADEDLIVHFRLLPGKEISKSDLEKLLYEAQVGRLMEKVYRLISVRMRSEGEIRQYFKIKNQEAKFKGNEQVADLAVEQLIERCKEKKLIDDFEFAKIWVEARKKSKKLGNRALRMELIKKGIGKEIIESRLDNKTSESNLEEEKLAQEALQRRIKRWENLPSLEFKKKATDYLLRKGFDYSLIRRVLQKETC